MSTKCIVESVYEVECDRCHRRHQWPPSPDWPQVQLNVRLEPGRPLLDLCPDCFAHVRAALDDYDGAPVFGGVSDPAMTSEGPCWHGV